MQYPLDKKEDSIMFNVKHRVCFNRLINHKGFLFHLIRPSKKSQKGDSHEENFHFD